jgi:valyl-tRNA synthetase
VRQIRGEMDISPGKALPVLLQGANEADRRRAKDHLALLQRVGRIESIAILETGDDAPPAATALLDSLKLLVPLRGLIDVDAERARLDKQVQKLEAEHRKSSGKLGNQKFVNNAPAEVVSQERDRLADFERQLGQLAEQRERLDLIS